MYQTNHLQNCNRYYLPDDALKYAPRSRTGCVPCRRRRKRCPGETPACQACIRLNIECTFDPKRRSSESESRSDQGNLAPQRPASGAAMTTASTQPDIPRPLSPVRLPPQSPLEGIDQGILLSYYIHTFVPSLSVVNIPNNYFTSVYVPMAFRCDGVLDAIVAAAAFHLAKGAGDEERMASLAEVAARRQSLCHKFLQDRISLSGTVQRDPLEAMTIILMLVGLQVQNGGRTSKWMDQLDCLRKVIQQWGGKEAFCKSSWEAECIYQHFLYHDVMSLIMERPTQRAVEGDDLDESLGQSPAVPAGLGTQLPWQKYLDPQESFSSRTEAQSTSSATLDNVHPLLGLSKHLFFLMQKIRRITMIEDELGNSVPTDPDMFSYLEREISGLKFELYPRLEGSAVHIDVETRLDLLTLAETYRLAALILLYRRSSMHAHQRPLLARNIISMVDRIPSGNRVEAGLTYPLFLAGGELSEEDEIVRCASKLISIRERVKFLNIEAVEAVLEEVWRERLNGGIPKDWECVLSDWQWVINLG
ncbi:hypothetical protein GQ53DRAFT_776966 [Thozetella sp. PMI_491]|nr:hypothetical protein GQ53DRAFT_776966 [Thozetella sp. PMI_491]